MPQGELLCGRKKNYHSVLLDKGNLLPLPINSKINSINNLNKEQ
jgi:hypothetical protein